MLKFSFKTPRLSAALLTCLAVLGFLGFALPSLVHPVAAATVTLYLDCSYLGGTFTFSGNVPDFTQYSGLNDAVSSLRVPAGYVVTLYQDINYQGAPSQAFTSDNSCLVGSSIGNDHASSMTIYPIGYGTATLYADCNFGGSTWYFSGTVPDFTQYSGLNDAVSSLRIPSGYLVMLFSDINFKGTAEIFGQDQSCLVGSKIGNDQASSMVVLSAPRPTAWDRNESPLGWGICNHYWGNCPTSAPYWDGGFMDEGSSYADATSVLIAFPGTGSLGSLIPAGNYLALGMVVQSQSNVGDLDPHADQDMANIAMVYLTSSGQPMIIGEVWGFHDANPTGTPFLLWGASWICDCFTGSNYQNLVTLTMSWSGNTLTWKATIGGVQYSLFSYAKDYYQENLLRVGINSDIFCSCNNEWFQFGVMANFVPGAGWNGYVGAPRYVQHSNGLWTNVVHSTWIGNELAGSAFRAQLDHWYGTGSRTPGANQGDSYISGGSFPGTSQSLVSGQLVVRYNGGAVSPHGLWDSNSPTDTYAPGSAFAAGTPLGGTWQRGQFSVSRSDSDGGPAISGVALCFWSVDSYNGIWYNTLSGQPVGCNSTQQVTVGSSGYCQNQGSNSCRANVWSEDYVGNIGFTVSRSFSVDTVPPSAPSPITPSNGATGVSSTPTLTWAASSDSTSGISSYTLQLSTSSSFNQPTTYAGITGTSYTVTSPLSSGTWYWRVEATDNAGNIGPWSTTFSFTVAGTVSGNLLVNPGFETGDFTGWTQTGMIIRGDAGSMHSGLYGAAPAYNPTTQIYSAFTLQQNLATPVSGSSISTISLWYRWGTSADSVRVLYTDGTYTQTNLPFVGSWTQVNAGFLSSKTISGIQVVRTSGQTTNLNLDDFALS